MTRKPTYEELEQRVKGLEIRTSLYADVPRSRKMKGKGTNPTSISDELIWIGIGLAAFWWFLESAVHVFIFREGELIQQIFAPEPHETWMRLIVVAILIAFAIYAQFIITQRERAEQATEHAYAELNQIFDTAADGMRVIDKDFNVLRVNETFSTLSGISNDGAAGRKCYEVFRGPLCNTPECPLVRVFAGEERVECDVEKERKDGVTVPCIVTATPFVEPDGKLIGIVEDFKDISERKREEAERERLNAELMNKNRDLEQIVYVTSHDLRSPLVNIQGFSGELERAFKEVVSAVESGNVSLVLKERLVSTIKEDIPEALQYIFTSVSKMDSLLSGLLKLSRLGRAALDIKPLDMNKLMSSIVDALEFQVKKAAVTLQIEELPSCYGDATQIDQVFSNLVENALKFFDSDRSGIIRISGHKKNGQAIYCVEDDGIGIPAEHQKVIFEIFHQLDPKYGAGEGLGLTIVRRILDRHGGRIWLESEAGKGSKFFVSLPAEQIVQSFQDKAV